jgi:O-antigen/teichoic acid export membrane protein
MVSGRQRARDPAEMISNENSAGLRDRTVKGVGWSAFSQIVSQSLIWLISLVLARLLGPEAYGLIGMTAVFTGFATLFVESGLGEAIIQRRNLEKRHLDSAFWINAVVGGLMTLLMIALAPVIAKFYGEPRLTLLTGVSSFQFFIGSLNVVQRALIRREMRFRLLAKIQIMSATVGGAVGLAVAFLGGGVWSLVTQTLAAALVQAISFWRVGHWRPDWEFDLEACKDLFRFSAYLLGFNVVQYWGRNADNLLIGRLLGAGALGIYARAYTLMLLPLTHVSRVVAGVMAPALSLIQDDKARVRRSYLKAISIVALVTFPLMTGFFVTSEHLILTLLGAGWAAVIPIFKILCGLGLLQSITTTNGWIYQSQGRTSQQFKMGLINSASNVIAFVIGVRWGISGVAWAYCVSCLARWYPVWSVCGSTINLSFGKTVKALIPPFLCATLMASIVWIIGQLLPPSLPHWLYLLIEIPCGVIIYLSLVASARLQAWQHACNALGPLVGGRFDALFNLYFRYIASRRRTSQPEVAGTQPPSR